VCFAKITYFFRPFLLLRVELKENDTLYIKEQKYLLKLNMMANTDQAPGLGFIMSSCGCQRLNCGLILQPTERNRYFQNAMYLILK